MSNEQRWMINDALSFLMKMSRPCCLGPVRFVEIRKQTFIYFSPTLLYFSLIIATILQSYTFYLLYLMVCNFRRGWYNEAFLATFNISAITIFNSYAILYSESRIKNFMTCLTKLERAVRGLHCTEKLFIKKWHIVMMLIVVAGGIDLVVAIDISIYSGSVTPLGYVLMTQYVLSVIVQQQFLYFALYVSFVLKVIKEKLQEEFYKIKKDKDRKQIDNNTAAFSTTTSTNTTCINIPLQSNNKAIDMIGMADNLFPDLRNTTADYRTKQNTEQRIREINESYVLACEVMRDLSSAEGFLLFLLLIYCSISIVYCTYVSIKLYNRGGSYMPVLLSIQGLELLMQALRVTIIVEPCQLAYKRISKIRFVVCEIMCYVTSKNDPVFRVVEGFYHQFVLNDISYTALGICKIGRSLVTSILGVVTTVLITIFEL